MMDKESLERLRRIAAAVQKELVEGAKRGPQATRYGEPLLWEAWVSPEPILQLEEDHIHWEGHVYFRRLTPQPIWAPEGLTVTYRNFPDAPVETFERRVRAAFERMHFKPAGSRTDRDRIWLYFEYGG